VISYRFLVSGHVTLIARRRCFNDSGLRFRGKLSDGIICEADLPILVTHRFGSVSFERPYGGIMVWLM
jgi:hypothetical protein